MSSGAAIVTGALAVELTGQSSHFTAALHTAPLWLLGLAILIQLIALIARTEAWNICVRATGATVSRRVLFRAAGVGYLASVVNGSLGLAARIASLRRSAPETSPRVPALLAAEVPIIGVEVTLAAVFSFTLIGPLGLAWFVPVIAVGVMLAAMFALRRLSDRAGSGCGPAWQSCAAVAVA